eukprot:Opistho-1_new@3282
MTGKAPLEATFPALLSCCRFGAVYRIGFANGVHAMIEKHATAIWKGSLKEGGGTLNSQSGALSNLGYTFATRFEGGKGTNPEELIGAAHAGCYAMFLSALMSGEGIVPENIEATSPMYSALI